MKRAIVVALIGCGAPSAPRTSGPPTSPSPAPVPAPVVAPAPDAAPAPVVAPAPDAPPAPVVAPAPDASPAPAAASSTDEVWLRGNTHVHARPSGDSSEPIDSVVRWYQQHGYDFIALTDHNRVSEVSGATAGKVAVHENGFIVLAGTELTYNRKGCEPPGDDSGNCRIHVNALGVTARPPGKLEWPARPGKQRVELYEQAFALARDLGATLVQINHPQYYWGMTADVLTAIGKGAQLVEVANAQFTKWNAGDATHLSTEALWDAALANGLTLWGVASDDAHDYQPDGGGKYPAGGGWVMVKARREPTAILAALAKGRFYASTGVMLSRAERVGDELVIDVAPGTTNQHTIAFVENGKTVATVNGPSAKHRVPRTGYLRAVVTRDDGKQAWVQPVRP